MTMKLSSKQAGFGLIDAVIALAVMAFGMLALARFQAQLAGQGTEAQQRVVAAQFTDELLNTMLVDLGNAACYTLPAAGACASATARARADDWKVRALAALPGTPAANSALGAGGRFTVTLTWTGKEGGDTRTHEVISDARGN